MFRKVISFLLLFCLVACATPTATPALPIPSGEQSDAEELAVYAAVLAQMYSSSFYVIMGTIATDLGGLENTEQTLDYVLQSMHDVTPETVESFQVRNEEAYTLRPNMDLGVEYILLSQAEKNKIFAQNQSGWEIFYNRYPDAPGITTLSRVGFNTTLDQALVYIGMQSNWLAGTGYYILLKRLEGVWTIDQKVMTWVS